MPDAPPPDYDAIFAKVRGRRQPASPEALARPARPLWPFVVVLAVLGVGAWALVRKLAEVTRIQDCVMAGRKNCQKISDPNER